MSPPADRLAACLPDVTTTQRLPGLSAPVDILRDRWGIPHIRAANEADVFFAQGFATAQDRLWHMDADRHQALGRWAEWVGASGLERDRLLRPAGMGAAAQGDYAVSSRAARSMLDAYAAGVNAFLATTRSLPIEYELLGESPEPWLPWHGLAVYKIRNSLLGTFEPKLLRTRLAATIGPEATARMVRGYPRGWMLTVPPGAQYEGEPLDGTGFLRAAAQAVAELGADPARLAPGASVDREGGSNGWAVSGAFTASGLPLVAGDSHRALDVPTVYYQVHLSCPEFAVIGHSLPGMPGALHFCHNEHVAWGMTHGVADTQDLFLERFRPAPGGRQYEFRGAWRAAEVRREGLAVRGGAPVDLEVTVTHHGPVIAGDPAAGWGVAIRDPGLLATPWPDAALAAMKARSVAQLHAAFAQWTDRVNNYAVADTSGHFGYLHEGRIPIREPAAGWAAVRGWTGQHEWEAGDIPPDELPRALDPACGWAVTCNQRVAGHEYPHYVGLYMGSDHRARRVRARIEALPRGAAGVDDMAAIHAERESIPARAFVGRLLAALAGRPLRGAAAQALAWLHTWDFRLDREAAAPTVYHAARRALVLRLAQSAFGAAADLVAQGAAGTDTMVRLIAQEMNLALAGDGRGDGILPAGATWDGLLRDSFAEGVAALTRQLGADPSAWTWGRVHRTRGRHPLSAVFPDWADHLDPPGHAVHGDGDTPLAGSFGLAAFTVTGLSVNRYVFDPADWTRSRWIVPGGASGHPGSPHYADQARLHADVEYIPALWAFAQIEAEAETVQRLEPGRP